MILLQLHKYMEDYDIALEGFSKAATLNPTWEEAALQEANIISYLHQVSEFIRTKVFM